MSAAPPNRILVMAPRGRDAEVIGEVVRGLATAIPVADSPALLRALHEGADAAVVTEETFTVLPDSPLHQWLKSQPPWSDFPFVVLGSKRTGRRPLNALASLHLLGNVILLERPLSPDTLRSAVEAAVRARTRQYATRSMLSELAEAHARLSEFNSELERRIDVRTHELSQANNRLMNEIGERERAQSALLQAQKLEAIGQLTGGIAHDFNNLLQVIGVNLELLARSNTTPMALRAVEVAQRTVKRGGQLTAQLLAFARSQSLLPRPTEIHTLIAGMCELIGSSIGTRIALRLSLEHPQPVALIDPNQLEMAILNLVLNARDAMPSGGTLTIASSEALLQREGHTVPAIRLSITDTGHGIPASIQEKVFEPFFTTKTRGHGTGLGGAQVYGFAHQSGGEAQIESTVGKGTCIHLLLPLLDQSPHAEPEDAAAEALTPPKRILVVEDDPDVRQSLIESLELMGHRVQAVNTGAAALEALQQGPQPELLIVDYVMPGMNGAELINQVRQSWADIPIILATGYADMDNVARVLGAKSILQKPFGTSALAQAVHGATA
jgi:signal transduction histidine kinase/CheY-like chemotaxis protein